MPTRWSMFRAKMIYRPGTSARSAALAIGLGIPAFLTQTLVAQRAHELADAEQSAVNTVRALEHHAARTVEATDAYLRAVASLVGPGVADSQSETLHSALRLQLVRSRGISNIVVIDRNGRSVAEAAAYPTRPLDVHERAYFKILRDRPSGDLEIGQPIIGSLVRKPVLPIARRINGLDGAFVGIAQAVLDAQAFQAVYDTIDNGPGAVLSLWRADGTLLVRSPNVPEFVGRNYAASENYQRHILTRDTKPFWSRGITDGVERVIAIGFLDGYPLYASAALSKDEVLAPWRRMALTQGALGGGLTLVLVAALLILAREIEQRRAADTSIRASEERYRLLAENTSDLIVFKPTMTGERTYVSPAVRTMLGWEPEEYANLPLVQIIHPDEMNELAAVYSALSPAQPEATHVHRLRHKAGHYVWIESMFKLVGGDTGERTVVVSGRDVTSRRATDEALRESEARYRMLAENISDVIIRLSLDFERTYISPSCERLFGYTPDEMLSVPPTAFIHPDDVEAVREHVRLLAEGSVLGGQVATSYRVGHKLGPMIWVEATLDLVRDALGRPDSIVGVLRDIGARKADEALLRVAREQADAARVEAERANAAKGEFLAAMSHELRTPLNGVIGYSDLLYEEQGLAPTARQYAARIRDAGSALLTVVDDILDFSKIEAGQVELVPRPFALTSLIDGALSIVRAPAEAKGLSLHTRVASGLPVWVIGDHDRLRQILLNLLSNAIKFTKAGWVNLGIDAASDAHGQLRLRFRVSDTGIGIPVDKRDRLFQRFSQVDSSISRDFGGTGLGLAISKALVDLMNGTIGFESEPRHGSTFWFEVVLPAAAVEVLPSDGAEVRAVRVSRRLLLAEDVPINQELARAILERAGHIVDVVGDGAAAVAAVTTKRYDLVLMDIQMPTLDGIAATRRIRAMKGNVASVPIVAMTANVLPAQVAAFLAAGMDGHIGKPFRADALLDTIDQLGRVIA